jgi:hypothetical protein
MKNVMLKLSGVCLGMFLFMNVSVAQREATTVVNVIGTAVTYTATVTQVLSKPGEPIKGVGVIIQRRPGGSASQRIDFSSNEITPATGSTTGTVVGSTISGSGTVSTTPTGVINVVSSNYSVIAPPPIQVMSAE